MQNTTRKQLLLIAWALAFIVPNSQADEGMWTYNQFPANKVAAAYGFAPDAEWLLKLQLASVRIAGGCSASIVSRRAGHDQPSLRPRVHSECVGLTKKGFQQGWLYCPQTV